MDDQEFTFGKYKGKTFYEVRTCHPDYFLWIVTLKNQFRFAEFIFYCKKFLTAGNRLDENNGTGSIR